MTHLRPGELNEFIQQRVLTTYRELRHSNSECTQYYTGVIVQVYPANKSCLGLICK